MYGEFECLVWIFGILIMTDRNRYRGPNQAFWPARSWHDFHDFNHGWFPQIIQTKRRWTPNWPNSDLKKHQPTKLGVSLRSTNRGSLKAVKWNFWRLPWSSMHAWLAGKSTTWRCISYWKWWFSNVMLVFRGVMFVFFVVVNNHLPPFQTSKVLVGCSCSFQQKLVDRWTAAVPK